MPALIDELKTELLQLRARIRTFIQDARRLVNPHDLSIYALEKFLLDCDDLELDYVKKINEILPQLTDGSATKITSLSECSGVIIEFHELLRVFRIDLYCLAAKVFVYPENFSLPFDANELRNECLVYRLNNVEKEELQSMNRNAFEAASKVVRNHKVVFLFFQ